VGWHQWSPSYDLSSILRVWRMLMEEPSTQHPLRMEPALLYKQDRALYKQTAREWTHRYAK
jgi:ubiquitin-protein ligase